MKKFFRRVSAVVVALAVALTMVVFDVPETVAQAATSGNLSTDGYCLDSNGKLTIATDAGMTAWATLAKDQTSYCNSVKNIEIKSGVTFIGSYAFGYCSSSTPITIPNSVTSIKRAAFQHYKSSSPLIIPNSVNSIESAVFQSSNFTSIMILNSNTTLAEYTFNNYKNGAIIYPSGLSVSSDTTQAEYTQNGGKLKITKITYGSGNKKVTVTDNMNINFVVESERTKVSQSGHAHLGGTATCKDKAKCEICNAEHGDKLTTHTWNAGTVTTAATCTATGVKTYTCTTCGTTKTETIAATGHNTNGTVAHKDATCTAAGVVGGKYCTVCNNGKAAAEKTIAALGHNWSTTWSKDGTNHWHACSRSGCTEKNETAKHTFVQKSNGTNHWQECSVCGYKKGETAHSWGKWTLTTEPTLKTTGTAERTCSCGEKQTKTGVPKLTDTTVWTKGTRTEPTLKGTGSQKYTSTDYGTVTITVPKLTNTTVWTKGTRTEPTLKSTGSQKYTSTDYGTVTITVPKLTDTTVWTKGTRTEPTLNGTGSQKYTSTDYGTVTITIPKLTDTTVWTKGTRTEPTLDGTGSQKYTSTDYGTVTITIPKLTDETVWTKGDRTEPTLNGTGSQKYTSDDYGTVTITVPKLTDTTVWTKGDRTEPTLKSTGSQKYTSTDYGTVTITVPKLTDTTVWTKGTRIEPTLKSTGSEEYTSADYGKVTITIPALNDETVWTKDETQHVEPTEEEDGRDVYTSPDYGEVTVILTALGHTHEWGDWEITKAPTMDDEGTAKRVCTKNNAHTDTTTLPALTDTSVWTKDNNKHVEPTEQAEGKDVYTSEYGEVTVTLGKLPHEHRLTHVDEVPATAEKEGVKEHWHCNGCGKDFFDEHGSNEATADALKIGKIETEVQAPANVPKPEIATPKEELIAAALTQEEQEKVKDGTDIKIILKIEDASDSAPAEDKEKIDTAIGGLEDHKLGLYLDITLLKKIGEQEHEAITNTSKPIAVTFEIPEALRGMAKYSVIRIHNGETTVLEDEDSDLDTITIKTDKFSTYALTYQDKPAPSDPNGGNTSGNQNPPSGDNSFDSNNSDTASSGDDNSSDENTHTPNVENSVSSESDTGKPNGNPSTGVAISFVPLAAVAALITAAAKRKKK